MTHIIRARRQAKLRLDEAIRSAFRSLKNNPGAFMALQQLLPVVQERSNLMDAIVDPREGCPQIEALRNLAVFHLGFKAGPCSWKGSSGRLRQQINDLASHLVGGYEVPTFMASLWFGHPGFPNRRYRQLYAEHARGTPLRRLLPEFPLTRRMEHIALQSPDHLEFCTALRRAELLALGAGPELLSWVLATDRAAQLDAAGYWRSVFEYLVEHQEHLDQPQALMIMAYMEKTRRGRDGRTRELKGQSLERLCRTIEDHGLRERFLAEEDTQWRSLGVSGMVFPPSESAKPGTRQVITELRCSASLIWEGRRMRHCVASYIPDCRNGHRSIWSLRMHGPKRRLRPQLTIEVDNSTRMIVQVKGRGNRPPEPDELALVRAWAANEGLDSSRFVPRSS